MNTPLNRITLDTTGNLCIIFPPDLGKISRVKEITNCHYDKTNKVWVVPQQYLQAVLNTFPGFALSDEVQAIVDTYNNGEVLSKNKAISTVFGLNIDTVNNRKLFAHQKSGVYAILKQKRIMLCDEMGLGKAQDLDAKLLTPEGYIRMGDIKVGDSVINSYGKPTEVVGVFPQGVRDIYKISFSDGTSTTCDEEHLWTVQSANDRFRNKNPFRTKSLKELNSLPIRYYQGNAKWYIPIVKPIEFSKKELLVEPYLLGLLLGDGGLTSKGIRFTSADEEILNFIKDNISPLTLKKRSRYDYSLSKGRNGKITNHLVDKLKILGLMGLGSSEKFIPKQYLFSSIEDRLALLRGLMDTDGTVGGEDGHIEFNSTSKALTEGIIFIVQSLGGTASKKERYTSFTYKGEKKRGKLSSRVSIVLNNEFNPFRLERKASIVKPRIKYFPYRTIMKIEYVGKKEAQCIKVASEDAMYLTNDCIVTHNTTTALVAGKITGLPIYVIAPRSLFTMWQREADLLGIPITKLISWAKIPSAPMEDFYCIMDEAQALQTFKRHGTQSALLYANKARYVVAITGTPCKNGKPGNMFGLLCAIHHPISFREGVYKKAYSGASNLPALYNATRGSVLLRKKEDCIDLPDKIRTLRTAEMTPEAELSYNNAFNTLRMKWRGRVERGEIVSSNEKLVIFTQLRHAASWAKLYAAEQMAEELDENETQAVFFTAFTDTADAFTNSLGKFATVGKITGDVSQKERQRVIDEFQAGKIRFIVATFGAGGIGITLTSGYHAVLIDRAWTPGDCIQAEDRLHRIGQKNTVLVDWLQCNTTDKTIDALLLKKQAQISTILTGNTAELPLDFDIRNNMDDIFNEIFK